MDTAAGMLRFGGASLDPERGVLRRADGEATTLRPKTLDLLLLLLRAQGRLVTRNEILDTVWADVTVTDDSITQCVGEIRRAMGDEAALLNTIPKRGYVLEVASPAGRTTPARSPLPARADASLPFPADTACAMPGGVPVVAMLPLRQVQADMALAVFAEGVLDGVAGALAALREPIVISANSTFQLAASGLDPRAIADRLGAQYIASGSVRRLGPRLRLTVELAEAKTAAVLWQRGYDITDAELFETQDRIAAVIANTLVPRVQEAELRRARRARPGDLAAYHLLLEARQHIFRMERDSFHQAGDMLRLAVGTDPGFAPAQAALADWHSLRIGQGWSPDVAADLAALEQAVQTALSTDGENARALALLGHNHTILRRRYDAAVTLLDRALDAAPNDAEAWMWSSPTFAWMGEGAEAIRRAERAISLSPDDPLRFRYDHFLSIAHYTAGDYEAAAHWGVQSRRANPHYTSNLRMTAASLAALGRVEEARPLARTVMELEPGFRVGPMIAKQPFRDDGARIRYGEHLMGAGLPA